MNFIKHHGRCALLLSVSLLAIYSTTTFAKEAKKVLTPPVSKEAPVISKSRFEKLELFNKILYLIETQYYREVSNDKLIEGALKGMMNTLDPHSAFLDKEIFNKMQEETKGEFGGLGIEITYKDSAIIIVTPIEDSPAYKLGIKAQDRIVEINGESTSGMNLTDAIKRLKGEVGTKIKLGIAREGEDDIKEFEITREVIKTNPVKFELVDDSFAYIRLTQFQQRSAENIQTAIVKLQDKALNKKLKGIILDLRGNPGGLLDEAVAVSSLFLKEGVVVSTESRDPKNKEIKYVIKTGFKDTETPMIVLVNGSSASASEIVTGALQDHKRATVMGVNSFGKGSVQTVAKIDDENGLKLTIAQYMTPSGKKIQAIGIKPDIEIEDLSPGWEKNKVSKNSYFREKDLRNHLTATVENDEEKEMRLKEEREERSSRMKEMQSVKSHKDSTKEAIVDRSDLKAYLQKDFQFVQALNFFKAQIELKSKNAQ